MKAYYKRRFRKGLGAVEAPPRGGKGLQPEELARAERVIDAYLLMPEGRAELVQIGRAHG